MKKVFLIALSCLIFSIANAQTPVVNIQQVEVSTLKDAPLGSYALMSTIDYMILLAEGYENNHGMEDHEFGFKGENAKYWVAHPDAFIQKKDLVFTYGFTQNGIVTNNEVRITVPYGTVMVFKKGAYSFAEDGSGWEASVDLAQK